MPEWAAVLCGYALGSIPFAFLLARGHSGVDIRASGSGNVGATNVARLAGTRLGVAVLLLDVVKGTTAVWVARLGAGGDVTVAAAGLAAVVGHVYPVWLWFRGGKAVAVACGVFATLAPTATALAALTFTVVVWATRYVSLGSIVATATVPPAAYAAGAPAAVVMASGAAALLIVWSHRSNLARIRAGTERRLGSRFDHAREIR